MYHDLMSRRERKLDRLKSEAKGMTNELNGLLSGMTGRGDEHSRLYSNKLQGLRSPSGKPACPALDVWFSQKLECPKYSMP